MKNTHQLISSTTTRPVLRWVVEPTSNRLVMRWTNPSDGSSNDVLLRAA